MIFWKRLVGSKDKYNPITVLDRKWVESDRMTWKTRTTTRMIRGEPRRVRLRKLSGGKIQQGISTTKRLEER